MEMGYEEIINDAKFLEPAPVALQLFIYDSWFAQVGTTMM